jgi:hypothetical protein
LKNTEKILKLAGYTGPPKAAQKKKKLRKRARIELLSDINESKVNDRNLTSDETIHMQVNIGKRDEEGAIPVHDPSPVSVEKKVNFAFANIKVQESTNQGNAEVLP